MNFEPLVSDYRAIDHQWDGNIFATAGAQLDIWDHNRYSSPFISLGTFFSLLYIEVFFFFFFGRSQPVSSYEWGTDSVISVRFNPGEPNVLATSARYV